MMRSPAIAVLILAACSKAPLPPLPTVNTNEFSSSIRSEIERELTAAKAAPQDGARSGRLGMLLHAHDRMEAAMTCYDRARLLQPEEYRWIYLSGVIHASLSRNQEAADLFRKVLEQKPEDVPAQLRLADALLVAGKYGDSRKNYESVAQRRPGDAIAYFGIGRTYSSEGNEGRAAEFYQKACERYPRYAAAQYALGLAYRQLGRAEDAAAHLKLYEEDKTAAPPREDPLLAEVQAMSGGILPLLARAKSAAAAGRLREAVDLHTKALEIDPNQNQIHINLISLYGRLRQFDSAEAHYRAVIARNANQDEAHYNYAVLLTAQGRVPDAIAAYRRTVEINPMHAEAHNNLAYLLAERRSFDEALRHATKALESKPGYPQAHYNAAMILLQRGQAQAAVRHLEQAIAMEPNEPRYVEGLAKAREYTRRAAK
jgi:tetratricopeptide (TPR) repeat protein